MNGNCSTDYDKIIYSINSYVSIFLFSFKEHSQRLIVFII